MRGRAGQVAFAGIGLLLAGEWVDCCERLEGAFGLGALNLIFAVVVATLIVCPAAVVGEWALAATERRIGRRPATRLAASLLALGGGAAACGILVAHRHHPLGLDGYVGLGGSLLLLVAAIMLMVRPREPRCRVP